MSDQFSYNQFNPSSSEDQKKWNEWVLGNMDQSGGSIPGNGLDHTQFVPPAKEKVPVGYLIAVILLTVIIVVQIIILVGLLRPASKTSSFNTTEVSVVTACSEFHEVKPDRLCGRC